MCRLLETIKIQNGEIYNLFYHNNRIIHSRKNLLGLSGIFNINDFIKIKKLNSASSVLTVNTSALTPLKTSKELAFNVDHDLCYKLRVIYSKDILDADISPYKIKKISSLKIIKDNNIEYSYKYENREYLNSLFIQRESCDDILIVKNNLIADSSFANLIFFDGTNYITPSKPLLNGTKREKLLQENKIIASDIKVEDIASFQKAFLINAMVDLNEMPLEIKNIYS